MDIETPDLPDLVKCYTQLAAIDEKEMTASISGYVRLLIEISTKELNIYTKNLDLQQKILKMRELDLEQRELAAKTAEVSGKEEDYPIPHILESLAGELQEDNKKNITTTEDDTPRDLE